MIENAKVSEIRKWPKDEWGYHISPAGDGVSLGDGVRLTPNIKIPDSYNGLTFQFGFFPCTISGEYITSGCYTKTPDEWLEFLTPEQAQTEHLPDWAYEQYYEFFKYAKELMKGE